MSISQLVPGVSGGTIAIVLGIYDRLLEAVSHFWKNIREHSRVLLAVGLGAVIGMVLFANGIRYLLELYPIPLGLFFIAVILGGVPLMYKKASERELHPANWIFFVLGAAIVLLMSVNITSNAPAMTEVGLGEWMHLFLGGFVFAIALILPGISGSFMLLVLGLYNTMIAAAADFQVAVLIPLGLGTLVGIFVTARIIDWLLRTYPQASYLLILGFVIGSVYEIFPGLPQTIGEWITSLIVSIAGFWFVVYTSRNS